MPRSNNFADGRNYTESHIGTERGTSGTTLTVVVDFSVAGKAKIAVTGITGGGFKKVNVFLSDFHDNQVAVSGTTANIASTEKDIAGFNQNDDLRVSVFASKAAEGTTGEMPLLASTQPDGYIERSKVDTGKEDVTVVFKY